MDGDIVVVEGDDRVRVRRRRQAEVRVVADAARSTITVIAAWSGGGSSRGGAVDRSWYFREVQGAWPLESRWQGQLTLYESLLAGGDDPQLRLETPRGSVVFMSAPALFVADPPGATVIRYRGLSSRGPAPSFDDAEQTPGASGATWTALGPPTGGPPQGGVLSGVVAGVEPGPASSLFPVALRRVDPAFPDPAATPGVAGVIAVQVIIAADGSVRDAGILQGIPALNELALTAAREWRFNTGREGRPFTITWPYPMRRQ